MNKVNVFMDMDGVLAEYKPNTVKYMYDKGFFSNRPPVKQMIELTKSLDNLYNVYILSSVIDSPYCIKEKREWLNNHLPEIAEDNMIFVPYGESKSAFAQAKTDTKKAVNVLLDDLTDNLDNWDLPGALPIKVLNEVNNTKGTWLKKGGDFIRACDHKDITMKEIMKLINS